MSEARPERRDAPQAPYRVELLHNARCVPDGIAHDRDGRRARVAWGEILRARAAEVGEPEGVRTIVFDLVVGRDASGVRVLRFDAEPGESAMLVARQLGEALGPDRSSASIKSVAVDGIASRWYPDLGPPSSTRSGRDGREPRARAARIRAPGPSPGAAALGLLALLLAAACAGSGGAGLDAAPRRNRAESGRLRGGGPGIPGGARGAAARPGGAARPRARLRRRRAMRRPRSRSSQASSWPLPGSSNPAARPTTRSTTPRGVEPSAATRPAACASCGASRSGIPPVPGCRSASRSPSSPRASACCSRVAPRPRESCSRRSWTHPPAGRRDAGPGPRPARARSRRRGDPRAFRRLGPLARRSAHRRPHGSRDRDSLPQLPCETEPVARTRPEARLLPIAFSRQSGHAPAGPAEKAVGNNVPTCEVAGMASDARRRVAVVGATGVAGQQFLVSLAGHPWFEVTALAASPRSAGKRYRDGDHRAERPAALGLRGGRCPRSSRAMPVADAAQLDPQGLDLVFSAVESDAARKLEERFAPHVPVVSTSSAFRYEDDVPIIVPGVNHEHAPLVKRQQRERGWKGFVAADPELHRDRPGRGARAARAPLRPAVGDHDLDAGALGRRPQPGRRSDWTSSTT